MVVVCKVVCLQETAQFSLRKRCSFLIFRLLRMVSGLQGVERL